MKKKLIKVIDELIKEETRKITSYKEEETNIKNEINKCEKEIVKLSNEKKAKDKNYSNKIKIATSKNNDKKKQLLKTLYLHNSLGLLLLVIFGGVGIFTIGTSLYFLPNLLNMALYSQISVAVSLIMGSYISLQGYKEFNNLVTEYKKDKKEITEKEDIEEIKNLRIKKINSKEKYSKKITQKNNTKKQLNHVLGELINILNGLEDSLLNLEYIKSCLEELKDGEEINLEKYINKLYVSENALEKVKSINLNKTEKD